MSLTSINAELDYLRNLSAHGIFRAVFEVGAIFFEGVGWVFIGASTVVMTVAKIALHRVYAWNIITICLKILPPRKIILLKL